MTLHKHLQAHGVDYLQFSFRWMNNLLTRELPLYCTIRLWDTYLAESDGFAVFQLYVCAAFLLHWREQLLQEKDFQVSRGKFNSVIDFISSFSSFSQQGSDAAAPEPAHPQLARFSHQRPCSRSLSAQVHLRRRAEAFRGEELTTSAANRRRGDHILIGVNIKRNEKLLKARGAVLITTQQFIFKYWSLMPHNAELPCST